MMYGLSLRVSWICLLLFSSGACFPATKGDYRYPYTWSSGGGSAPGSNLQSEGSRPPLVNLQYEPSVSYQQPEAAPQQASYSTGNQSPSSVGASSASAASSPSYGQKTPSFSVQPQSAAGTSGNVNMGSGGAASGPVYGAAPAYPAAGYMGFGYGAVPYFGAPAASSSAGAYGAPAASSSAGAYGAPAASSSAGAYGAPAASSSAGAYSAPAASSSDGDFAPGLPWSMQPAGGADSFSDPSNWMPSRDFPDFSVWDSNAEMPQSVSETSPLLPSSYIIQSRNGYERERQFLSHTKYSPEYPEPPVFAAETVKAARVSPPEAGRKGGKKA